MIVTISQAMAPVAAVIIPGRPPVKAMMSAVQKKAYNLTLGSTPAIMENAIASGMGAKAAAMPASTLIHRIHRPAEHKLVVYLMGVSLG